MQKNPFDRVSVIAADVGLAGQILRRIPEPWHSALLSEADKKIEPWKWLLSLPNVPDGFRKLFTAAQSQRVALYRIAEMARRGGTIDNSWGKRLTAAMKVGDTRSMLHAQKKVFQSFWEYDHADFLLKAARKKSPALEAEISIMAGQLYKNRRRKLGPAKADSLAKPAMFEQKTITDKVAWCLVTGWLRVSNGLPGLCFFTDEALTDFIREYLKFPGLTFDTVRKTRQLLGLKKATVFIAKVKRNSSGRWEFLDRQGSPI